MKSAKYYYNKIFHYLTRFMWFQEWMTDLAHKRQLRIMRRQEKELQFAKELCDARSRALHGKYCFVLPDYNGNLKVLTREEIKVLKRKKIMSKQVNGIVLKEEALYWAGSRN